jgi:predicted lipase
MHKADDSSPRVWDKKLDRAVLAVSLVLPHDFVRAIFTYWMGTDVFIIEPVLLAEGERCLG